MSGSGSDTGKPSPASVRKFESVHNMPTVRVIARLDIKGPNLVKGVHLEGLRVLGKPEDFAEKYYQQGIDELIYIDAVASLYGRENLLGIVQRAARNIFVPLTAGGGVRSIEDMRSLLRAGADKVAINTAAIANPSLIREGAKTFGAQCIVVSICAKQRDGGWYEAMTDNAREKSGKNVYDWAREVTELGAGEILLTSIDREGTGKGYDLDLIRKISDAVPIPVIACGGAGRADDCIKAVQEGHADAVCAASIFHYCQLRAVDSAKDYSEEGNIEFLKKSRGNLDYLRGRLEPINVRDLKDCLSATGISCRRL